ncbi:MAG: PhoX family phosphatase [Rhodospirillales bacterium]|nr:PhoX family phosphatase [Rhodospirillales bacterium]
MSDRNQASNAGDSRTFAEVLTARASRRDVLAGGLAAAVTAVFAPPPGARAATGADRVGGVEPRAEPSGLLGFKPVTTGEADTVVVPEGYRVDVLAPWGTALDGGGAFSQEATGAEQGRQVGSHHDGMHFFPLHGSSTEGLLVVNHEYVEPRFLHAAYAGKPFDGETVIVTDGARDADEVLKEMNAHGVSVLRIGRGSDGKWSVRPDPLNRRITALTPMAISGPARGAPQLRTRYSPDGTGVRGTLANCSHGVTPWNTYMAAEENWAGYFRNNDTSGDKPDLPREQARYDVAVGAMSRYGWELAADGADETIRFDASRKADDATGDYRNEPNAFGWMVEIDPFDPRSVPVKRTHLGRFAHENVIFAPARAGKPVVCYAGDDSRFEYIYKFVSAAPFDPATASGALLDEGTLYAARFHDDGSGEWLALVPGKNGLTPENGFADLAEILINTRLAADRAGATRMDRPEWGAIDPTSGAVFFTLTNNTRRTEAEVDAANPRAQNRFGQIIRWREAGDDHAAETFDWDLFVLAGAKETSRTFKRRALGADNIFACPDGLWCDADGRLWIETDIGEDSLNTGGYAVFGNNQMLAADPRTGEIRRFLTGPVGQEMTGVVTTPDQTTMFVNVQHPGATTAAEAFAAGNLSSHWPDGGDKVPRSATLAIQRADGGKIGA